MLKISIQTRSFYPIGVYWSILFTFAMQLYNIQYTTYPAYVCALTCKLKLGKYDILHNDRGSLFRVVPCCKSSRLKIPKNRDFLKILDYVSCYLEQNCTVRHWWRWCSRRWTVTLHMVAIVYATSAIITVLLLDQSEPRVGLCHIFTQSVGRLPD